jgi:hypothetical protein
VLAGAGAGGAGRGGARESNDRGRSEARETIVSARDLVAARQQQWLSEVRKHVGGRLTAESCELQRAGADAGRLDAGASARKELEHEVRTRGNRLRDDCILL